MIKNKQLALIGVILLVVSISLGALGAHALTEILNDERLKSFLTANHYMSLHGLAFMILALFPNYILGASKLILAGLLLFSGSIFMLITFGHQDINFPKILGLVTPIGGILMIVGWLILSWKIWRAENQ